MKHTARFHRLIAALLLAALMFTAMPTVTAHAENVSASARSTTRAKVTAQYVYVYKKASTSSAKLGRLRKGASVNIVKTSVSWAYVERYGNYGYCKKSALTAVAQATPAPTQIPANAVPARVTADYVDVYKKASTSSTRLGRLSKGAHVNLVDINGSWAYVERGGAYGYCKASAISEIEPEITPAPTATATIAPTDTVDPEKTERPTAPAWIPAQVSASKVKVYKKADTSSDSLGTLSRGARVNIVSTEGSWAYVERLGMYGYCAKDALTAVAVTPTPEPTATPEAVASPSATVTVQPEQTPATGTPAEVVASYVNVYKKASSSSTRLGRLSKGAHVNIVSINGSWAYVERLGMYGYCKASALKEIAAQPTPPATQAPVILMEAVINANTKVYKKATTTSASANVAQGTKVYVLELGEEWSYIRSMSGVNAYIKTKYLSTVETMPGFEPIYLAKPVPAVVITTQAALFSEPGFWGETLDIIKQDTKVNIIATIADYSWVKIDWNGKQGWVAIETLGPGEEYDPLEGFKKETFGATVVTQIAKFYGLANTADGTAIPFGTDVTVTAYNAEWAYVTVGGQEGFILVSDLNRKTYEELTLGNSAKAVKTLETALLSGGYFDGNPDDSFDNETVKAIKRLQTACGQKATGVATEGVQRMVYSGNAPKDNILSTGFKIGDKGEEVTRIQTRLFALGYLSKSTSIDGEFGDTTSRAISLFQVQNNLDQTGSGSGSTVAKLYSAGAVTLPADKAPADMGGVIIQPESGDQKNNSTSISKTLASVTSQYSEDMSAAEKLEYVIYNGQNQLGKPYIYGANGPNSYDCTGFTCYCFKKVGVTLKRTAQTQGYDENYEKIESPAQLKRGDLVFFNTVNDNDLSDHAGIYLGAGWFIHSSSGQGKVVVSTLAKDYYSRVFSWGYRVLE